MPSKYGNDAFYKSKTWRAVSAAYMSSKHYICERCGRPARICHHKTWLNARNINDPETTLSFDNLEALCIECHNAEHGLRHDITLFDDSGNVSGVKAGASTKEYQRQREQLDDVIKRARALSVVSCKEVQENEKEKRYRSGNNP